MYIRVTEIKLVLFQLCYVVLLDHINKFLLLFKYEFILLLHFHGTSVARLIT